MEYKRKHRALSDATKQKISMKLKNRKKSLSHCQNISKGLVKMWQNIEPQKTDGATNNGLY